MPFFEDYGPNFHLFHFTCTGNLGFMHMHPQYEMCLIPVDSDSEVCINGRSYSLHGPVMILHAPFCLHKLDFAPKTLIERFVCYFGENMLQTYSDAFYKLEPYFNDNSTIFYLSDNLVTTLRPLIDLMKYYHADSEEQKLLFLLILNTILKSDCKRDQIGTFSQSNNICQIIRYMHEYLAEDISADSVAQNFFISRSKLNKDFRKYTNVSFHGLLLEMRMNHAIDLLREGKHDISSIASLSGFDNENYFFALFKKKKGTTPLKYLKKYEARRREEVALK